MRKKDPARHHVVFFREEAQVSSFKDFGKTQQHKKMPIGDRSTFCHSPPVFDKAAIDHPQPPRKWKTIIASKAKRQRSFRKRYNFTQTEKMPLETHLTC